ncbi:MAG: insulinase family protein, partial [Bacteroidia bacterium]
PYHKLFFLKNIVDYDLPDNYAERQNKILQAMTKEEIDELAKKWLDPEHMVIMVVGDKEKIGGALSRLGYEVVEVDNLGNPTSTPVELKATTPKSTPAPTPPKEAKKKTKKKKGAKYDKITK